VQWLDKKSRFTLLEKSDKVKFIENAVDNQLKEKTISELSVNRYLFLDRLNQAINVVLENYAQKQFDQLVSKKKISTKPFEKFPETITLKQEIPQEFNRNYYEKIDKLNKEELNFVERLDLDSLDNIDFWVRSREKQDPFYIQGWKRNKFYPDFVVVTKKGNVVALEWKGEDRVSNEDTEYKVTIGDIWSKLGGKKLHFFLVHKGNEEEVLIELKKL
jgi:type III restriction enzyme